MPAEGAPGVGRPPARPAPAGDGAQQARVGLLDEEADAAPGREGAEDERVADRGEVLAPRGEEGLARGAAPVEGGRVLRGRARVVVAAAARGRGVADREALERGRRVRRQRLLTYLCLHS